MSDFNVVFKYFSCYENSEEDKAVEVHETWRIDSLEDLLSEIEEDMDFDDSEGINFDASSEMIEAGRELLRIYDKDGKQLEI